MICGDLLQTTIILRFITVSQYQDSHYEVVAGDRGATRQGFLQGESQANVNECMAKVRALVKYPYEWAERIYSEHF